jgi:hypothetical protein
VTDNLILPVIINTHSGCSKLFMLNFLVIVVIPCLTGYFFFLINNRNLLIYLYIYIYIYTSGIPCLTGYCYAAIAGDWLQGPYVYYLYSQYGFGKGEIGQLFIAGFGSSMLFGTIVGSLADKQ